MAEDVLYLFNMYNQSFIPFLHYIDQNTASGNYTIPICTVHICTFNILENIFLMLTLITDTIARL